MFTPQQSLQIQAWRKKVSAGTITKEELREAMELLRQGRAMAHETSATSRARKSTTAAKKNVDSDKLLGELDGL